MSSGATRNISVTKKPRYVIFVMTRTSDTTGRNYAACYDSTNDAYSYAYYGSDGYAKTQTASGKPSIITTVSATTVTVANTTNATCRTHAFIYY